MPTDSKRTICALSAPVTVFADEFMAELVQKISPAECASLLQKVLLRSQDRLLAQEVRNRRSDAYKAVLMARGMADRIRPLPDELAVLLGEKSAAQTELPGVVVDTPQQDDFEIDFDVPTFQQYSDVFQSYPFAKIRESSPYGKLILIGYCSGHGKTSNKLYRRNCVVVMPSGKRMGFKDIASAIGMLSDKGPDGTHYTIKAIPFMEGIGIRFWTNIVKEGDVQDQYRYMFFASDRIVKFTTESEWELYMSQYRSHRESMPVIH